MQWYYARDDEQVGPVTDEQFQGLVEAGEVTGTTLVSL